MKNSGDVQEVQVPVTLTIKKPDGADREEQHDRRRSTRVRRSRHVPGAGQQPADRPADDVTAAVEPVENEANVENNSFDYPVAFSF